MTESSRAKRDSLEQRICASLWRWATPNDADASTLEREYSYLGDAIEYYICGLFQRNEPALSRPWWCDGILGLQISRVEPSAFKLTGAAIWAEVVRGSSFYRAPFELEFHFAKLRDASPNRVVFRFGVANADGDIERVSFDTGRSNLKAPTADHEWAVSAELSLYREQRDRD